MPQLPSSKLTRSWIRTRGNPPGPHYSRLAQLELKFEFCGPFPARLRDSLTFDNMSARLSRENLGISRLAEAIVGEKRRRMLITV